MNNSMVAHLWANEMKEFANGSNFYFEGESIYSYGSHFEVGRIVRNKRGEKAYLINDIYRSSSTSKHQCCVCDAIPTGSKVFSVGYNMSNTGNMAFVTSRLESIKDAIEKHKRARTELPYQNVWGAFKNILSGERVKDIDIFFESESDFQEAIDSFNDEKHQKEGWKFKYRNEKVCAFQKEGEKVWIEFIESEFGKPKEILRSFDFTVTKMAYYKEPKYEEKEDDYFPFSSASIVAYEYKLLYHEKFFEHLHMKRLVIDENIPFPVSTWERSYRYKGYGYNMCRETKKKLLQAIKGVNVEEEDVSLYTTGGWD